MSYDPTIEQPRPQARPGGDVQSLVIADIEARRQVGIERYGTPLQTNNGRDALRDAYDEVLDLACYLRQEIEERAERARPRGTHSDLREAMWAHRSDAAIPTAHFVVHGSDPLHTYCGYSLTMAGWSSDATTAGLVRAGMACTECRAEYTARA